MLSRTRFSALFMMAFLSSSALSFSPIRSCFPRAGSINTCIRRPRFSAIRMTSTTNDTPDPKSMTEADWKAKLTREEYHVLRQKGTERAGTGEYDNFYPKSESFFACRGCGNPLYSAESKFKSGCGWPAFDKCTSIYMAICCVLLTSISRRLQGLCQDGGRQLVRYAPC